MTAPNANGYDYAIAKAVLSETEKDRFLACYLNLNDSQAINWDKAATDFGSASTASFKKMIQTACKKITEAQKNGGAPPPASAKKSAGGGKKRKAATDGDDEEGTPTLVKKGKGGGKKKKADTPVEEEDDTIKAEGGDEQDDF